MTAYQHTATREKSLDRILKRQSTSILSEIARLSAIPEQSLAISSSIRLLKQDYNLLVEEEYHATPSPFIDPLVVLPPELWRDIMPHNGMDEVLKLTLVSTKWRQMILSTPGLWSIITLDQSLEDCTAKAILCLRLSEPFKIHLKIDIPLTEWLEVAHHFVLASHRIASIGLRSYSNENLVLYILNCFPSLPALQHIYKNLGYYYERWPRDGDDRPSTMEVLRKMPEVRKFGRFLSLSSKAIPCLLQLREVELSRFSSIKVHELSKLAHLHTLNLQDTSGIYEPDHLDSGAVDLCLSSVTNLQYAGKRLMHTLTYVSSRNLLTLRVRSWGVSAISEMFTVLRECHQLQELDMKITQEYGQRPIFPEIVPLHYKSGIRKLILSMPSRRNMAQYGDAEADRWREVREEFFYCLISVTPFIEDLTIQRPSATKATIAYIKSLGLLQSLDLPVGPSCFPLALPILTTTALTSLKWRGLSPESQFLDVPQVRSLRFMHLRLKDMNSMPKSDEHKKAPFYHIFSTPFINLKTLSLDISGPLLWDLTACSGIEQLIITGKHVAWAGDIFEEILLQPEQWSRLRYLSIGKGFLEWDILILMLERRNIIATNNLKPIRSVTLDMSTSYKLDDTIIELLQGKFSDRDSIQSFSTDAIGKSLWDPLV